MANSVKLADVVPSRFAHLTPASEENIERIRLDLENGSKVLLNVPHVFKNEAGKYELLAGHDRTEAWRRAKPNEPLPVREFYTLNTDDNILAHFCRENLLRKDVSKAAIAGQWLKNHPDWTDVRVAVESGCSNEYVGQVRADLIAKGLLQVVEVRTRSDGQERTYKPRQVRSNVPSGKTIPHPTEKVMSREDKLRADREAEWERRQVAAKSSEAEGPQGETPESTGDSMSVDGSPGKVDREPEASGAGMEPAGVGAPLEEKALVGGGGSVSEHVRTLLVSLADLPDLDGSPDDWRNAGAEMGRSKYQAAKKWANAFGVCLLYVEQGVKEAEKANAQTEEAA